MVTRKKRRLPKALQLGNTNTAVREESSLLDFYLVVVIITVVAPLCVYCFG